MFYRWFRRGLGCLVGVAFGAHLNAATFSLSIVDDSRTGGLPAVSGSVNWAAPGNPYPSWTGYNWSGSALTVTLDITSNSGHPRTVAGVQVGGGSASTTFSGSVVAGSHWTLTWHVNGVRGWSSATGWTMAAGPPGGYASKLSKRICNDTLQNADFTYAMTDSAGSSYSGEFFLAPGQCYTLNLETPAGVTPGNVVVTGTLLNSDMAAISSTTDTYLPAEWDTSGGVPPTVSETAPTPRPTPVDTTSKTTPSIDFGTSTGAASESSLKTGLSSVRSAIAESSQAQGRSLGEINSGVGALASAVGAGNSQAHTDSVAEQGLLGEILGKLERLRTNTLPDLGDGLAAAWASWKSSATSTSAGLSTTITGWYQGGIDAYSTFASPFVTAANSASSGFSWPTITLPGGGSLDTNPRLQWQTGVLADMRAFFRWLVLAVFGLLAFLRATRRIPEAVARIVQGPSISVTGLSAWKLLQTPAVFLALSSVILAVFTVVTTAFAGLAASVLISGTMPSMPVSFVEILIIGNDWVPIGGLVAIGVAALVFDQLVEAAVLSAMFFRVLLPHS